MLKGVDISGYALQIESLEYHGTTSVFVKLIGILIVGYINLVVYMILIALSVREIFQKVTMLMGK